MNLFLNCTAHSLTDEQLKEVETFCDRVIGLSVYNEPLFKKLINCPSEENEIIALAYEFKNYLQSEAEKWDELYVHLPIGSPAFMFIFAEIVRELEEKKCLKFFPVFSHTTRISEEIKQPDGSVKKVSKFKFKKFIFV